MSGRNTRSLSFQSLAKNVLPGWMTSMVSNNQDSGSKDNNKSNLPPITPPMANKFKVDMVEIIRNRKRRTIEPFFKCEEITEQSSSGNCSSARRPNHHQSLTNNNSLFYQQSQPRKRLMFHDTSSLHAPITNPIILKKARYDEVKQYAREFEDATRPIVPIPRRPRRFHFSPVDNLCSCPDPKDTSIKPLGFQERYLDLLRYIAKRDADEAAAHPPRTSFRQPPSSVVEAALAVKRNNDELIQEIDKIVTKRFEEQRSGTWTCHNCHTFVVNSFLCQNCGISRIESRQMPYEIGGAVRRSRTISVSTRDEPQSSVPVTSSVSISEPVLISEPEQTSAINQQPDKLAKLPFSIGSTEAQKKTEASTNVSKPAVTESAVKSFNFGAFGNLDTTQSASMEPVKSDDNQGFFGSTNVITTSSAPILLNAFTNRTTTAPVTFTTTTATSPSFFTFGTKTTAPVTSASSVFASCQANSSEGVPPSTELTTKAGFENLFTKTAGAFGNPTTCATVPSTNLFTGFGATTSNPFGGIGSSLKAFNATTTPVTTTTTAPSLFSGFGANTAVTITTTESGIFGGMAQSAASTSTLAGFGISTSAIATTTTSGLFGSFSAMTTASNTPFGGFGSSTAAATTTASSLFGAFSSTANSTTASNMFGSFSATNASMPFGTAITTTTAAAATPNLFGGLSANLTTQSGFSGFGSTATTAAAAPSLFGGLSANQTTQSGFGVASTTAPSLFGGFSTTVSTTQSPFSGFGSAITTTAAAAAAAPSLFGGLSANLTTQSGFGSTATSTTTAAAPSLFGGLSANPTTQSGFGVASTTAPSLFGGFSTTVSTTQSPFSGFGSAITTTASSLFGGLAETTKISSGFGTAGTPSSFMGFTRSVTSEALPSGFAGFGKLSVPSTTTSTSITPFGQKSSMFGTEPAKSLFTFGSQPEQQQSATGMTFFGSAQQQSSFMTAPPTAPMVFGSTSGDTSTLKTAFVFGDVKNPDVVKAPELSSNPQTMQFSESPFLHMRESQTTTSTTAFPSFTVSLAPPPPPPPQPPSESGSTETNPFNFEIDNPETISQRKIRHARRQKK
ncbi:hypothetical protein ACOME3_001953 [Neoechinorhynchus agilis]